MSAISWAVVILAAVAVGAVLYVLEGILMPLMIAGLLSILFRPMVRWLRVRKVPMAVCLLVVLIISGGLIYGMEQVIEYGIVSASEKADLYSQRLTSLEQQVTSMSRRLSREVTGSSRTFDLKGIVDPKILADLAVGAFPGILNFVSNAFLVLLYLVFMVLGSEEFPRKLKAAFSSSASFDVMTVFERSYEKILKYLRVKTFMNLLMAVLQVIVLWIFGVDFLPVMFLIIFFLHYIPNIGSVAATVVPAALLLVQNGDLGATIIMLIILIVIGNVIGNGLEPRVMGGSLDLSPVVVLFSLLFWGWMWGIVGMIISVPLMAVMKVFLEHIPATRPIAVMLGNKAP